MDLNQILFGIYPYICLAVFFIGSLVRFDREQYSWRSGSSQLLRARQLRLGSNLFHAGVLFLLGPRLGLVSPGVPRILWTALALVSGLSWLWWGLITASWAIRRPLLPEKLAERGPFLRLMRLTSRLAQVFGRRDWVENAAVKVYNSLAFERGRKVGKGELLLLIPRCLSKETLNGVLEIAGRYDVPVFVATRGQLARRVIRERRPRAVVAVACERDMVSGLHDVAGKIPVLGLTMTLPAGPCKDALLDLPRLEEWVKSYVV